MEYSGNVPFPKVNKKRSHQKEKINGQQLRKSIHDVPRLPQVREKIRNRINPLSFHENEIPYLEERKAGYDRRQFRQWYNLDSSQRMYKQVDGTEISTKYQENCYNQSLVTNYKGNTDINRKPEKARKDRGMSLSRQGQITFNEKWLENSPKRRIILNERPLTKNVDFESKAKQRETPNKQKQSNIKLRNMTDADIVFTDTLHNKSAQEISCGHHCVGSQMGTLNGTSGRRSPEEMMEQAENFLTQYYTNIKQNDSNEHKNRWQEVRSSIQKNGSYHLTYEELVFGSKLAWRNAPRCIGRIQWSNLQVFDARHVQTAKEMFKAICRHLEYATNNGNIRSAITVFRQRIDDKHDFRVWNPQLIMYAGYKQTDGSVIGDPGTAEFTSVCIKMGWKGQNGMFDVLPLVLQANGGDPEFFEIPKHLILEVNITHPRFPSFEELGLKWICVPAVSGMKFDCGGIEFTGAPFNGWYMSTEIACRDLCDEQRYNLLQKIAENLGIDTGNNTSLWKDRAVVETNIAVLHSFQKKGVTIVDHHTASETFMTFMQNEHKQRGGCPADWVWIVPPMSGSLTPVFHQEMALFKLKPSYEYQDAIWKTYIWHKDRNRKSKRRRSKNLFRILSRAVYFSAILMTKALSKRVKCTILFATETGRSEKFANMLHRIYRSTFNSRVLCMDEYNLRNLQEETMVLFVSSTFGNGDSPENGKNFAKGLGQLKDFHGHKKVTNGNTVHNSLKKLRYAVFGLGSRAYPNFCAFSHFIDKSMNDLGANRVYIIGEGDELSGQEEAFRSWAKKVYQVSCKTFNVGDKHGVNDVSDMLMKNNTSRNPGQYRLVKAVHDDHISSSEELSRVYRKQVFTCTLIENKRLEKQESSRRTILVKIEMGKNRNKLDYKPGDHVLLFPNNPSDLVDDILQHLHDVPVRDQIVRVECVADPTDKQSDKNENQNAWNHFDRFPSTTFQDILTRFLDITTPPSQELLNTLSSLALKNEDKTRIKSLSDNTADYNEWKSSGMPNILDLLKQFPSLQITAAFLITQLPLLQPRYYSISSSHEATPGEIHVTADVLEYQTPNGRMHKGVCSNWLNTVPVGGKLNCTVRASPLFHLPEDKTLPIIMVGPGTGIAPFRGFLMQRQKEMTQQSKPASADGQRKGWGDMYLYFGCRTSIADNIYKDEIKQYERENVLTKCFFAYSREQGTKKTYVQDIIQRNGRDVYQKIVKDNGHFYICGSIQMASDVKEALLNVIHTFGGLSLQGSQEYLDKMKSENRFHEDIFGLAMTSSAKGKKMAHG